MSKNRHTSWSSPFYTFLKKRGFFWLARIHCPLQAGLKIPKVWVLVKQNFHFLSEYLQQLYNPSFISVMNWTTLIFLFFSCFAHCSHHQHGIYKALLPSGFPGSDASIEEIFYGLPYSSSVGVVQNASSLQTKDLNLNIFQRKPNVA